VRQHHEIWILNFVVVQTHNVFVSYIPLCTRRFFCLATMLSVEGWELSLACLRFLYSFAYSLFFCLVSMLSVYVALHTVFYFA
jgi:hypothetical protein